jgi:threonine/homoserine/homoserine lactone efflux protein
MFGTAFIIGLSGAMMPGPVLVATINRSARMGFKAGPLVVLGHAIIEAALVTAIIFGLGAALEKQSVVNPILLFGGAMLVFMGVQILNELRLGQVVLPKGPEKTVEGEGESVLRPVIDGIITSGSNPYWMVWWATIGLALIYKASELGNLGIPTFYTGHILSDLAWYSVVSAGIAVGTRHMTDLVYQLILGGCSLFLIGLGLLFASQGVTGLFA